MNKTLISLLLLLMAVNFILAQEAALQPQAISDSDMAETSAGVVTFSFKDADIRNVLRLIAAKSGVNIVYGPEVTGIVNMELKDVPWEQALSLVLDLNGYAYQKEESVIKVLKKEDVSKEPLSTSVFALNYIKAADAKSSVEHMLSEKGKINIDTRTNSIIVTDIPSNINKIEEVIKRLDMRTMQVLIEAKILSMSDSKQKDLGIKWTSLQEYTIGIQSPVRQYQYVRRGGKGVWDDSTENVDTDGSTDTKTTTNNTDVDRDVIYSPTSGTYSDTSTYNMVSNLDSSLTKIFTSTMLKSDIRTAILSASDFQLVLSALQSQTDVSLISNPRILTANNEKAEIKIVSEYPIPNYTFDTTTSTFTIAGFDFKPIGVIFAVVPNISFDGYVTMQIDPEVSTLLDEKSFSAGGATVQIPYIGRKKASAKLVIKSGETLAIGGLIDEQNKTVVTKVPLLGDIPVLGRLFRHDSVGKDKANIIFFITATVIDDTTKGVLLSGNESSVFQAPADVVEQIVNVPKAEPIDAGKNTPAVNKGTVAVAQKPKEAGKTSGISVLKRDSSDKD